MMVAQPCALFIGRFQPFHSGHLSMVQYLTEVGYQHIVIGIGSAQYARTADNPLTDSERLYCIRTTLANHPQLARSSIVALPDIHDDTRWVDHVNAIVYTVTPQYDVVVSGNSWVQGLFKARAVQVIEPKITIPITGTAIRKLIRLGNTSWKTFVDPSIQLLVEQRINQYDKH